MRVEHRFVDSFPRPLEKGILYVSIPFASTAHLCCCGCRNEVIAPLTPHDWTLSFDGDTVSLDPSIGNWGLPCRSHYWIWNNEIRWARAWTEAEIEAGRAWDRASLDSYYARRGRTQGDSRAPEEENSRESQGRDSPRRNIGPTWTRKPPR